MAIVSINETTARGYYQALSTEAKPTQAVQDGVKIAEIDVDAGTTAITNAMITKTRTWTAGGVND